MVNTLTVTELKERISTGFKGYLLDVREPEEIAEGQIPGSLSIPLGQLRERASEIPKDSDIVVICRSGIRSYKAAFLLSSLGFFQVFNLEGGLKEWKRIIDNSFQVS